MPKEAVFVSGLALRCTACGHVWKPHVARPGRCPRCWAYLKTQVPGERKPTTDDPRCQHDNSTPAKFCIKCGAPLVLTCGQCRAELPAEAGFCPECGCAVEATPGRIPGFDVPEEGMDLEATLHKIEAQLLIKALERTNGVQTRAATLLGLGYHEFRYKIQKHKLESLARSIAIPGRSLPRGSGR